MNEPWHAFLQSCLNVSGLYVYRGTIYLGVRNLSWCRNLIENTCGKRPMSKRSGDWGVGICQGVEAVLKAGSPAKTMTSPLIIPTVLAFVFYFKFSIDFINLLVATIAGYRTSPVVFTIFIYNLLSIKIIVSSLRQNK